MPLFHPSVNVKLLGLVLHEGGEELVWLGPDNIHLPVAEKLTN